jgi:tellurite resistance protein TerC
MSLIPWTGFVVLVLLLLALDLGVLNRRSEVITPAQALRWTLLWVSVALAFNVLVYFLYENHVFGIGEKIGMHMSGKRAATQFLTAYIVEESLSIDNLFVMAVIFNFFAVPPQYQHRVLFFGILGAIVFRGIFIGAGLAFINLFNWAVYVFGALLLYTAIKLLFTDDEGIQPENQPLVKMLRRYVPLTDS